YRDEYQEVLGENRGSFNVLTSQEWLKAELQSKGVQSAVKNLRISDRTSSPEPWYLFPHCTEATAMPTSPKDWQQIFTVFGETLHIQTVGCCGMAGVFGHEVQNQQMSREIYDQSWGEKIQGKPKDRCLATGYSCRSQVKRIEHFKPKHPVQALLGVFEAAWHEPCQAGSTQPRRG
ncbi:MAG: (Fe-S)-binding protein, partial [Actinobacillus porcinus]